MLHVPQLAASDASNTQTSPHRVRPGWHAHVTSYITSAVAVGGALNVAVVPAKLAGALTVDCPSTLYWIEEIA